MGAEVDTAEIAQAGATRGKRLAYPRLLEGDRALGFAACQADALLPGALRTREPPPGAPVVPLGEVDLVLVPGVAFDARGRRLGRGRGHYDATLAGLPASARRVGLAFELQIVSAVPQEPHDALLDTIVTEARVLVPLPAAASGDDGHH
jgi:5-formyltetrahydrofolate cyclo-ligase